MKEVPRLAGESPEDRRVREVLYLGLTRWLPLLLDRKDRLSMACGLEVRVPFTDHRLVEYVWNVPWAMKEAGGIEKGLLRTAAAGLLPPDLLNRRKSIYPGAADEAYERAIDAQLRDLLRQPSAPLFDLIDQRPARRSVRARPAPDRLHGDPAEQHGARRVHARHQPLARPLRRHHPVARVSPSATCPPSRPTRDGGFIATICPCQSIMYCLQQGVCLRSAEAVD